MRDVNMQIRQIPLVGGVAGSTCHIGHILMEFFNKLEDHVWQIDAATGEVEMKSSVKSRSIQLARCLRNAGLKPGDVVAVSGLNHLDVHIPFYAGYLNGLPLSGIDPSYKYDEIRNLFQIIEPKLVFCELFNLTEYEMVVKDLGLDTRIVTFGDSDKCYAKFVKKYDDNAPESEFRFDIHSGLRPHRVIEISHDTTDFSHEFLRVATFDANKVFMWLVSTSGTTGLPKVAAFSHSEIIKMVQVISTHKEKEIAHILSMSSVQWISGYLSTLCMISSNQIKVQTSGPATEEHVIDIINKYKPTSWTTSPSLLNKIMKHDKYCEMTCFRKLIATAFAMNPVFLQKLKKLMLGVYERIGPNGAVWNLLGLTECVGPILIPAPDGPLGNCGKELPSIPVQLVDTKTGEVIKEPNTIGELWTKGPRLTEYYKNPEATAATFSSDGWFKTGDLVYRDENGYFFFVERITSSFRFRNFFVTPMELEHVIQLHPDVVDVCVVGIPDSEDNMHAVACVQKRPGCALTEKNVKDIVADTFSFHKHLHGGVIFVDDFPRTFSDKIARGKVRDFVLQLRNPSEYPCSGNTKNLIITFQRLSSMDNVRLMGS